MRDQGNNKETLALFSLITITSDRSLMGKKFSSDYNEYKRPGSWRWLISAMNDNI